MVTNERENTAVCSESTSGAGSNNDASHSASGTHSRSSTQREQRSDVSKHKEEQGLAADRTVWIGRIIFLVCLGAVALTLGILANFLLRSSETKLAESQFTAISRHAIDLAKEGTFASGLGASSMSQIAAYANPHAKDWPL